MSFVVNNISYKYNPEGKPVLKNVSFGIEEAQVTAIVGPSGCGKSTLVSILSGVIPALMPSGELHGSFDVGKEINISVVSQSPENQLFGYGVEDAISFGIENMGLDNEEIAERVEYVLDLLNIQHLRKRSVATLSGGQRQAVCIASVLAMRPDILVMDEPVSSLDPNGKKMIQSVLNQLRATGQTTVIVDNNMDWFSDIVDHVVGLIDGEVVFDGDKFEFFENFEMQKKLGVTIPQEVEIYRELSKKVSGLNVFYTLDDAKIEIGKLLEGKTSVGAASRQDCSSPADNCTASVNESTDSTDNCTASVNDSTASAANFTASAGECTTGDQSTAEEILTASGICKTFRDGFKALIDINAGFGKGKVISILGQNGSGKTTLVKHLNGLYRPTRGTVRYKGVETLSKSVAQISKDVILVFQHPEHMLFEETVYRELTFCARAQGISFSETEALEVLDRYGMLEQKDELPVNLSMGKKHILTILSVLFSSAEVVILDEPTLGMDLHLKLMLEDIIRHLTEKGKTVIIISHEIPLVFKISDEILILNYGEKLAQDSKMNLTKRSDMFDKINISLPPVVKLSQYFEFPEACCDVNSFVQEIIKRMA